jgi:hypothetical protein
VIMREVSDRLALVEGVNLEEAFASEALSGNSYIPDTVPASFLTDSDPRLSSTR